MFDRWNFTVCSASHSSFAICWFESPRASACSTSCSFAVRPASAAWRELDSDARDMLVHVQKDLFAIGAQLADPAEKISARVAKAAVADADIDRLEKWIDTL